MSLTLCLLGCGKKGIRYGDLGDHFADECRKNVVTCRMPRCHAVFPLRDEKTHLERHCLYFRAPCPEGLPRCHPAPPMKDLPKHYQDEHIDKGSFKPPPSFGNRRGTAPTGNPLQLQPHIQAQMKTRPDQILLLQQGFAPGYRQVPSTSKCPKCNRDVPTEEMGSHWKRECNRYYVACACGAKVLLRDMPQHRTSACTQPVRCHCCFGLVAAKDFATHHMLTDPTDKRRCKKSQLGARDVCGECGRAKHEGPCSHLLLCPLDCGEEFMASQMHDHLMYRCKNMIMRCTAGDGRCNFTTNNIEKLIEHHLTECDVTEVTCPCGVSFKTGSSDESTRASRHKQWLAHVLRCDAASAKAAFEVGCLCDKTRKRTLNDLSWHLESSCAAFWSLTPGKKCVVAKNPDEACDLAKAWTTWRDTDAHAMDCPRHEVPCRNKALGCDAKLPQRFMRHHIYHECEYERVDCPNQNAGCEERCLQKDLSAHMKDCPYREVECPDCFHRYPLCETHECDHAETPCPNHGCDAVVKAARLQRHLRDCPARMVHCHKHFSTSHVWERPDCLPRPSHGKIVKERHDGKPENRANAAETIFSLSIYKDMRMSCCGKEVDSAPCKPKTCQNCNKPATTAGCGTTFLCCNKPFQNKPCQEVKETCYTQERRCKYCHVGEKNPNRPSQCEPHCTTCGPMRPGVFCHKMKYADLPKEEREAGAHS
eukprot:TRINITY_DN9931_c0_g2_i6.p1 TRINITY_DN9931_c0_g2~~TRINITY_DN9931_c0_g2_i6.p1  ORF type:complete len:706 (+),score=91.82 TRINITY_DN9931_c0_g2_i6:584-2701(+)